MIDEMVRSLVENNPPKSHASFTTLSLPRTLLVRLNSHRIQYKGRRESQHKCLERLIKFYEEHSNGTS